MSHRRRTVALMSIALLLSGCGESSVSTGGFGEPPSLYVPGPAEKVFADALEVVTAAGWQIEFTDRSTGVIVARAPKTRQSWGGESITIRLAQSTHGIRVDVTSTADSAEFFQKNESNVRMLLGFIGALNNVDYRVALE